MLSMTNPYDAVDIDSFKITPHGELLGHSIFKIELATHKPFDACVFRDALVRFLFEHMRDEWHLGNDDKFIQFDQNDMCLALSRRDAARIASYGWLI